MSVYGLLSSKIPIFLSIDNKTLSSVIEKARFTNSFVNHFREANEQ